MITTFIYFLFCLYHLQILKEYIKRGKTIQTKPVDCVVVIFREKKNNCVLEENTKL